MFAVGSHVMYGTNGVYTVERIGDSPIDKKDPRLFYVLHPFGVTTGGCAYVPVDSEQVPVRQVMSKTEAEQLIETLRDVTALEVVNERDRRNLYREAMRKYDPISCAKILRTVADRRRQFSGTSKRLPDTDMVYEREAKQNLFGELSAALGISFEETEGMLAFQ